MYAPPAARPVPVPTSLLVAKARLPRLPIEHVPRPELIARLQAALDAHRLVEITAGALAGKTTLLTELLRQGGAGRVHWYSVDELDGTTRGLLEGLSVAVLGRVPSGDETHLLAAIVHELGAGEAPALLALDDVHRSPAVAVVVDRLIRYVPANARLLLSGRPSAARPTALRHWLEDQGQVATFGTADLRMAEDECRRFADAAKRAGGVWPVGYRRGGHPAVLDRLISGILPTISAEFRRLVDLLAVAPFASAEQLAAACDLTEHEVARQLLVLERDTILLERTDQGMCRLPEIARDAVLQTLDAASVARIQQDMAGVLEEADPFAAARLFAQSGNYGRAIRAARRVDVVAWQRREADALVLEGLLPRKMQLEAAPLALILANRRLAREGAGSVHAYVRALRPLRPEERVDRLRLLGLCAQARNRPWGLQLAIRGVERIADGTDRDITLEARSYALATLGTLLWLVGQLDRARAALQRCLRLLDLLGGTSALEDGVRLQALHMLALVHRRLGALEEAEQLYTEAAAYAQATGKIGPLLELVNNQAVLLQQSGRHHESELHLRQALARPWAVELGLAPLLLASLADALAAQGERSGAIRALRESLAQTPEADPRGVAGHARASLALLLAEAGEAAAAEAALAAAPPRHPAALLTAAILMESDAAATGRALHAAIAAAGADRPLRAQGCAHLARWAAAVGDSATVASLVAELTADARYPLTPREAAHLGELARHRPPRRESQGSPQAIPPHLVLQFFAGPVAYVDGIPLGAEGWRYAGARTLFWYALAHGRRGFTRQQAIADLFGDVDGVQGGRALRNVCYGLRRLLHQRFGVAYPLPATAGRLRLVPEDLCASVTSDLDSLSAILPRLQAGEPVHAAELLTLLEQPFLADLDGEWLRPFRAYWDGMAVRALALAATQAERAGQPQEALLFLTREVAFCPDDPTLTRQIMRLAHVLGDIGAVRATFMEHCRTAREDLGVAPDAEVVALYEALLRC